MTDLEQESTHQGIDVERAVLGAVLSPGWRGSASDLGLAASDFANPHMGTVWETIERVGTEAHTVQTALRETPLRADGMMVVTLVGEACIPALVDSYVVKIQAAADRRGLMQYAQRVYQLAQSDSRDPEEVIDEARLMLEKAPRRSRGTLVPFADVLRRSVDRIENPDTGAKWPWDLNDMLVGLQAGRLYVVAARPGHGKTLVGQGLAVHFARLNRPVAVAMLEMPDDELGMRALSDAATVDIGSMYRGNVQEKSWTDIGAAVENMSDLPIFIDDTPTQTVGHIRRHAREVQRQHGSLGLIVVDYLQLISSRDKGMPRHEQVAEISRSLKLLARDLKVPVVAMAQLNRGPTSRTDKTPQLSDLRESGAIEADADVVILLWPDEKEQWILNVTVGKQRHGPKGNRQLQMAGHFSRLEDLR